MALHIRRMIYEIYIITLFDVFRNSATLKTQDFHALHGIGQKRRKKIYEK